MSEDLHSVLVCGGDLEIDPAKPQVIIKHGNHKGRLQNGKVSRVLDASSGWEPGNLGARCFRGG